MPKQKIILEGTEASPGVASGKVRVINGTEDFGKFEKGNVLVTEITDPSMVVIMQKACAIITDRGGVMSHPAIVSRELGIPCVVDTKEATEILEDGDEVKVDGNEGEVYG